MLLSAILAFLNPEPALAQNVSVRLEGPEVTSAQVAVTYVATRNLWWPGCQNLDPFFNHGPYAHSAAYDLHPAGGAFTASVPDFIGGFCGFGAPNGLALALNFLVNGLSTNTQVLVLPRAVEGVTGNASTPIRCRIAGDGVTGPFYRCEHPGYALENGAISLRLETY
jgi:hypothetical protein